MPDRCLDTQQIEALATGAGDAGREHVAGCADCREALATVEQNLALARRARASLGLPTLPDSVGPYRILRELGRGSMGVVYLAEQDHPRRHVALKLLPDDATDALARRIEREAEVLGQLRHPGIAQIFDAGRTPRPYFVMEYIEGERLDVHADRKGLDVGARVELLARICDAVEHAHCRGVVHRDLKPGNILVDASGQPKVLDFGVARLANVPVGGTSMHTAVGQLVGTIPFMSPEQVEGDPTRIEARSDVYALGVIGYTLLGHDLPHDLQGRSVPEAARIIRDEEPRPLRALRSDLPADLETILLKAIAKEPTRRYATAAALASDLRRYLRHEPIQARPPTLVYQARRFTQRNRALSIALVSLFLVLSAAVAVSTTLAVRARVAEADARQQVARYESVNGFLQDMLSAASPEQNPGQPEATVRDVLEDAVVGLDAGSLADQPSVELGVRTTLGDTYRALGDPAAARPQLERAVALGRALHPRGHPDLALALNRLSRVLSELEDLPGAETLQRECLAMRRRLLGDKNVDVATSLNNLADLRRLQGDAAEARLLHEQALDLRRDLLGPAHEDIANSLNNLAILYFSQGELDRAAMLFRESLEMDVGVRGELHPNVAVTMANLAGVLSDLEQHDEAEPLLRRVVDLRRHLHGEETLEVASALNQLARGQIAMADSVSAAESYHKCAAMLSRLLGGEDPRTRITIERLVAVYEGLGRKAEADLWRRRLHPEAP